MIPQEVGILEEAKEGKRGQTYYIILVAILPCQICHDLTAPQNP